MGYTGSLLEAEYICADHLLVDQLFSCSQADHTFASTTEDHFHVRDSITIAARRHESISGTLRSPVTNDSFYAIRNPVE